MTYLRNSRPEYHASAPYIGISRPAVAKIDAVWNDRNGWEITLTPNQVILNGNEHLKQEWISRMKDVETKLRADIIGEWPNTIPMPKEIEAYYRAAMSIQNQHCEPPDYHYTIRAYESINECKFELRLLLKILRELEFDKQIAGTDERDNPFRLLGLTEAATFPHQLGIADYIKECEGARNAAR